MQQSSVTPTRRRRSSGFSSISSFHKPMHSRKSSMHSVNSPQTPYRPSSALDRNSDYGFGIEAVVPEGLDNLAAELAEEDWDEEEDLDGEIIQHDNDGMLDPSVSSSPNEMTSLSSANGVVSKQQERNSQHDNGINSEDEDIHPDKIISPDLEQQLKLIEHMSKQDLRQSNKARDSFELVGEQLRDLSSQLNVEERATRLANTADTVSIHLHDAERYLRTVLHTYLSPFGVPPDVEMVESLQPMFAELISSIPSAPSTPLPAIHTLATSGNDILSSLAALGDNLYISQQHASRATQKLRSVQDIVDTIRRELRESDAGLLFLQNGTWEDKLRRREAAAVCNDVVDGFEKVCETWRRRLGGESLAVPG